tara:strand:- start:7 stop:330 length:324 start_codon:yes stop_codon:yes gene_type:complete
LTNKITKQQAISSLAPDLTYTLYPDGKIELAKIDGQENKGVIPSEEAITAEMAKLQAEYDAQAYRRARAKEYPDFREYLDGIVKGDEAQKQKYINDCLAVKAKYPKG